MTLEEFRRPRMLIQKPETPVSEAARAMESNQVGMVVVQERGRVLGVVTDRDLALRVVGRKLDTEATLLGHVMTPDPACLPISLDKTAALDLMRTRKIRRVILMDDEHVAGMVTIDDLLLPPDRDSNAIADVICAQLAEPAQVQPAHATQP